MNDCCFEPAFEPIAIEALSQPSNHRMKNASHIPEAKNEDTNSVPAVK